MKKFAKPVLALVIPFTLILSSCKKESGTINPTGKHDSDSVAFFASVDNDLYSVDESVDETVEDHKNDRLASSCYEVSYVNDSIKPVPGFKFRYKKFKMKFAGSCDSLSRSGEITIYQTGSWLTRNYKDSIVFAGYSTDGRSIVGFKTRSFQATSDLIKLDFNYSTDIKITTAGGKTVSYMNNGKKSLVNYLLPVSKYIEITGNGKFINTNGDLISYNITKPVVLNGACQRKLRFPVQGTINYSNTAASYTSIVDYGTGTCDKYASITVNNGVAVTFKMK